MRVYFFYNPVSGDTAGRFFEKQAASRFEDNFEVFFFDIRDGVSGKKPGFVHLRAFLMEIPASESVSVVVAGGDGSVFWAMSETLAHSIDPARLAFATVPLGTGNDFSRVTGWGDGNRSFSSKKMKKLLGRIAAASEADFDLFSVEIQVDEKFGCISKIKDKVKIPLNLASSTTTATGDGVSSLVRVMGNYCSLGVESRVGLGFDRHRTRSAFLNRLVYLLEGSKKIVKRNPKISTYISDLLIGEKFLSSTEPMASLVFLNIPSIAGGVDLWQKTNRLLCEAVGNKQQNFGDGQLEVLSVPSLFEFSRSKLPICGNNSALRLAQTQETVVVRFREDLDPEERVYMQIDGEYFQLNKPVSLIIQNSHKFRVLVAS